MIKQQQTYIDIILLYQTFIAIVYIGKLQNNNKQHITNSKQKLKKVEFITCKIFKVAKYNNIRTKIFLNLFLLLKPFNSR